MPKIRSDKRNVVKGDVKCEFCEKVMTKKDRKYYLLMCEKVPQEKLNQLLWGGSSVSFGTTSNSSLTKPLLGAPEDI